VLLIVMVLLAQRLIVYHDVTVVDVVVTRVGPDGHRHVLATPAKFARPGSGTLAPESVADTLRPAIDAHMRGSQWARDAPPGTRFEWTIRWSRDSVRLDHEHRHVWEVPAGPRH
jgi:hypothetical protein